MLTLLAGLVLFLGIHSISIGARPLRDRLAARWGERTWKGVYSVIATVGLLLILVGFGQARTTAASLYVAPAPLRWLAWVLMLPVFPLLLAAYLPGRIRTATRDPMLVATLLWATAHLLAGGTWPRLLLFGAFWLWAHADLRSVRRRAAAGPPLLLPARPANDAIAIGVGLLVYAWFLLQGHAWLIGVAPLGALAPAG